MASMISENESFQDVNGKPIVNGYIYVGVAGQDPKLNPVTIYSDRQLTTPLSNPQRTDSYGKSTNKIWVDGRYSLKIEDINNVQKLQDLERGETPSAISINLTNVQGVNSITAEASPAILSYENLATYILQPVADNTGAITLDAGGGEKDVVTSSGDAIASGEWTENSIQRVIFNSANDRFEMLTVSTSELAADVLALQQLTYTQKFIGEPFLLFDHQLGVPEPDNSGTAKYIKLTAGESGVGDYNEGLLINESVSGVSPRLIATAEIAVGPRAGETVHLLNTMQSFARPSIASGNYVRDSFEEHSHAAAQRSSTKAANGAATAQYYVSSAISSGSTGDTETAPSHVTATAYERIV